MYNVVDVNDNNVQFVGVYVTRWQQEWGTPTVGFVEADYQLSDAITELNNIKVIQESTYNKVLAILNKLDPYSCILTINYYMS